MTQHKKPRATAIYSSFSLSLIFLLADLDLEIILP